MRNLKKEINCKIEHGKLVITFYKGNFKIRRIKKGTKTIVLEFIILTPEEFEKILEGRIFIYRYIKIAKYSELTIIRRYQSEQKIVIFNEEIEEIKNSFSSKKLQ